jgi:YjjG family noncanonical pyrimidine nucleotidase
MAKSEITLSETSARKYACIFFDLDHTLWDYETNSGETLVELYDQYDLNAKGIDTSEDFTAQFKIVNTKLWELYDNGTITNDVIRNERFKQVLAPFGIVDQKLSDDLAHDYITECPKKGNVMPYALDVLDYLSGKYRLSVITNGFEEIQHTKLQSSKLNQYFDHIITSQKAGCRKPSCEIFNFALDCNSIKNHEALMVGDNLITDIGGACNAYIDAVFFNPEKQIHTGHSAYEIHCLSELRRIL